jgi:hypothetical protein
LFKTPAFVAGGQAGGRRPEEFCVVFVGFHIVARDLRLEA